MPKNDQRGRTVEGQLAVNPRGFAFLSPEDGSEAVFVAPPDARGFLTGDRVTATAQEQDGRTRARQLRLLSRQRTELFGKVVRNQKRVQLAVDPMVGNSPWKLSGAGRLRAGSWIVARIQGDSAQVERRVTAANASLERIITRYGFGTEFKARLPRKMLPAAERKRRRDLRELTTITIDAPVSRDLDDALSVLPADPDGALRLLVSIADVDALVPEGTALDAEARDRGTSVYLAGRVLPMLPPSLSEDALSLLPGVDRPALTVELRIDSEGDVRATDIYESVIRSDKRLSYEQVQRWLDGDRRSVPRALHETLRWLRAAVARLAAVREARGGVAFLREDTKVSLDEKTQEPTSFAARPSLASHMFIERLMVATNEAVARWMRERGLPSLYRVHDEPGVDEVRMLETAATNLGFAAGLGDKLTPRSLAALERQYRQHPKGAVMQTVLGSILGPARYTVTAASHFGLGSDLYLHFTSPIRRYADLCVHRIIKGYLHGVRDRVAADPELDALGERLTQRAQNAARAERERQRCLAARFFQKQIGEALSGNVVAIRERGLVIQISGSGASGFLPSEALPGRGYKRGDDGIALANSKMRFSLGQQLRVRVAQCDEELGRIELALARS